MHTPVCCRLPLPLWSSGDEWRTSLKQLHTLTRVCDWRGECVSLFGGGGGGGGRCISGGQTAVISRINRLPSKPRWIPVSTLPWAIMYPVYRCCREGNSRDFTDCETLTKVSNHKHTTNFMKLLWFKNVCRICSEHTQCRGWTWRRVGLLLPLYALCAGAEEQLQSPAAGGGPAACLVEDAGWGM